MRLRIQGTPYSSAGLSGTVYDAEAFVEDRLNLAPADTLQVFHRAKTAFAAPGQKAEIAPKNDPQRTEQFGDGFYASTRPELGYGMYQLDLSIPVQALAGKKVFQVDMLSSDVPGEAKVPKDFKMPDATDVIVVDPGANDGRTWFVFKPGSEKWVNQVSTRSEFETPQVNGHDPLGPANAHIDGNTATVRVSTWRLQAAGFDVFSLPAVKATYRDSNGQGQTLDLQRGGKDQWGYQLYTASLDSVPPESRRNPGIAFRLETSAGGTIWLQKPNENF